jgi:hypothetical protein
MRAYFGRISIVALELHGCAVDNAKELMLCGSPHSPYRPADGDGFRIVAVEIKTPLAIKSSQLVLLDEQREMMEERCSTASAGRPNKVERAATDLVIKALAVKAYPDDLLHPYLMADKICALLELNGATISRETVAKKLKAALGATKSESLNVLRESLSFQR